MTTPPIVLILGGTSGIGRGVTSAFARRGYETLVTGRELAEAQRVAQDLSVRYGTPSRGLAFDATLPETHGGFFENVLEETGDRLEGVVAAFGELGDHDVTQREPAAALEIISTNYSGLVSILTLAANHLERRRRGFIVGIGSVSGDRGRRSNYVYGSTKGAGAIFLAGLRGRLHPSGVRVLTVKPGFVDTAMTFGLPGVVLAADPERVGEQIARAVERGRDVIYVPGAWRAIMLLVRLIPERLFKRLKL
jgi:short-subunit dehydrogenase